MGVTSTVMNSVTCGAVKALRTIAAAVCLRTPLIGVRCSRPDRYTDGRAVRWPWSSRVGGRRSATDVARDRPRVTSPRLPEGRAHHSRLDAARRAAYRTGGRPGVVPVGAAAGTGGRLDNRSGRGVCGRCSRRPRRTRPGPVCVPVGGFRAAGGFGGRQTAGAPATSMSMKATPDLDRRAFLGMKGDHCPGVGRGQLDRCLRSLHIGDVLVEFDCVPDLHQPGQQFGVGETLTEIGQEECLDGRHIR